MTSPTASVGQSDAAGEKTRAALAAFHDEQALGRTYDLRLVARLWPFLRPYRAQILVSVGVGVLTAAGALAQPLLMRFIVDEGALGKDLKKLTYGSLALAAFVVLERGLAFIQVYAAQVAGARSIADMRRRVFGFLQELPLGYFDHQPVGRLVTRVTNDTDAILELFASGAFNALSDLLRLVGIVALMLTLDWKLSLVAFAAVPPIALLVKWVRGRARQAFREIRAKTSRMNANMAEQVNGMTTVQAFGQQAAAAREFDGINVAYRDAIIRSIKYDATQDAAIDMVAVFCVALMVMSVGYHSASYGTLIAFNAYVLQFFEPITALAQRFTLLQNALSGAERVFGLLDTPERDAPQGPAAPDGDQNLALSLEDVTFAYKPGVPVLKNVSFDVKRSEKVALVGATGAGKSTISALLLRLYTAQQGVVRVSGKDVRGLRREELRAHFAVVPQDVVLFPGTIASNIAAGQKPDAERVLAALAQLDALDLVKGRVDGLEATVTERGDNFSAGERQLIAFARALYRDADIIVLDEATASVDSNTERRMQRALEALLKGRTALIIAHRLSTIQSADRILTFHQGSLVENGTHDELLARGGIYARLHGLHFGS